MGFRKLMQPVAEYIEERIEVTLPVFREALRPPGALAEKKFRETCYRCGNCIEVCPAKAIRALPDNRESPGTPYLDPDLSACVICDELACMKACPSGALQVVEPAQIRMGTAEVNPELCVRSHGEECRLCVDKCPIGSTAVTLNHVGRVDVNAAGCVGCGTCQFYCPTTPKAIVVHPG